MVNVATRERTAEVKYMSGIAVPAESVDPKYFFKNTRPHTLTEKSFSYTGQASENVSLRKADILSFLTIRFSGTVTTSKGTGTIASTARWPYDFLSQVKVAANNVSNLINVSGLQLKIRDVMKKSDLTDRGVEQIIGGVTRRQGTLARGHESWGVGSNTANLADGTYDVELEWIIPLSEDEHDLHGALFLQTASADMNVELNFASPASLFTLTGNATVPTITGQFHVHSDKFSIPTTEGRIIVPDLSHFHSLISNRHIGLQNGEQEVPIVGAAAGKSMLRLYYQVWNGTTPAPLPQTKTNFGKQSWRYANNETPQEFLDGGHMRQVQERRYNSDVGAYWGVGCMDFAHENAFRDVVDLGTTSDLRLVLTLQNGVTLAGQPRVEYVMESIFASGQA